MIKIFKFFLLLLCFSYTLVYAKNSKIIINGDLEKELVAFSSQDEVNNTELVVSGSINASLTGARSSASNAKNNILSIAKDTNAPVLGVQAQSDALNNQIIISGNSNSSVTGAKSDNSNANGNEVIILKNSNSIVTGADGTAQSSHNKISIAGSANGAIIVAISSTSNANNNEINIGLDANALIVCAQAPGQANANKVNIKGNLNADIICAKGDNSGANNNSVNINGTTKAKIIVAQSAFGSTDNNTISLGADVIGDVFVGFDGMRAKGANNTINLLNKLTKVNGNLYLGDKENGTLNVTTNHPVEITKGLFGAQNINLNIKRLKNADTALKIGFADISGSSIRAVLELNSDEFENGGSIALLSGEIKGKAKSVEVLVKVGEKSLKLRLDDPTKHIEIPRVLPKKHSQMDYSGTFSSNTSDRKTNSKIKIKTISSTFGVNFQRQISNGKIKIEPFFELGKSKYELKGKDGSSSFAGVGVLARYDFDAKNSGAFVDGSLKVGENNSDIYIFDKNYRLKAGYFGAHFGLGYTMKFGENSADFYTKYIFVSLWGAQRNSPSLNSQKIMLGGNYQIGTKLLNGLDIFPYFGAGFEYSFDNKSDIVILGESSYKGGWAFGQIGAKIGFDSGLIFDFSVRADTGKQKGVNAMLNIKYGF